MTAPRFYRDVLSPPPAPARVDSRLLLADLMCTADDLTQRVLDLDYLIHSVEVATVTPDDDVWSQITLQLKRPAHPMSLVGLLVDLDCADITDSVCRGNVTARGVLPDGTTVKVFTTSTEAAAA